MPAIFLELLKVWYASQVFCCNFLTLSHPNFLWLIASMNCTN